MENIPFYIPLVFVLTTLIAVGLFFKASSNNVRVLAVILPWMALQAVLTAIGFYAVTDTIPPRFPLAVVPALALTIVLFSTPKGRRFIDRFDSKTLTILHVVRIPVELVLFWLYGQALIPELMTFEGRNFDIISGITAPLIFYFGYIKPKLNRSLLIGWNLICLALLFNIVIHAILSFPSPLQQLAFDQPNIGVLRFPFIWLPSVVVPIVLFSHLATLRSLLRQSPQPSNISSEPKLAPRP
jgi:hypothetical protein